MRYGHFQRFLAIFGCYTFWDPDPPVLVSSSLKRIRLTGQTADTGCKRVAFSGQIRGQKRQVRTTTKLQSGYFKFHTPRLADSRREDHNLRLQTRSDFESLGACCISHKHTSKLNHGTVSTLTRGRDNIALWEQKVWCSCKGRPAVDPIRRTQVY